jgi:hypothetical protein
MTDAMTEQAGWKYWSLFKSIHCNGNERQPYLPHQQSTGGRRRLTDSFDNQSLLLRRGSDAVPTYNLRKIVVAVIADECPKRIREALLTYMTGSSAPVEASPLIRSFRKTSRR